MLAMNSLLMMALYFCIAVVLRLRYRNAATAVLVMAVCLATTATLVHEFRHEIRRACEHTRAWADGSESTRWPPRVNQAYPDLVLYDQNGRVTQLSEFRGKVVLLELVAMSCPACVALSGGHVHGEFAGTPPQRNLQSIETYLRRFGGFDLDHPDLVFVQLILFDGQMEPPSPADVRLWATHFALFRHENRVVLAADAPLAKQESTLLVPGFHLIDRDFILRADTTGQRSPHNLYDDLIPMAADALKSVP